VPTAAPEAVCTRTVQLSEPHVAEECVWMDFAARSVLLEGEARVRLGEAFSVAGFVGRFLGV
jgi:hypothetical protein